MNIWFCCEVPEKNLFTSICYNKQRTNFIGGNIIDEKG
jgi:hypothetical protein